MSASIRTVLWSAVVITMLGSCLSAARAAPIDDCGKARGAAALQPCTQVIDDEKEKPATRAYARLLRARAGLDMSDLDRAEADIGAALVQSPNNTFAYRLRARLRSLQGKENEARADLTKAVQLPQSDASKYMSYLDRGHFYVRNMELPPALADFQAAVRIDPTKAAAYVGQGRRRHRQCPRGPRSGQGRRADLQADFRRARRSADCRKAICRSDCRLQRRACA
jgi:Tfp pilus assembly protein PilF